MNKLWMPLVVWTCLLVQGAQAATFDCAGVMTGRDLRGDVLVGAGKTCTITNTSVRGNVKVSARATLILKNSNVHGNVSTDSGFARLALAGAIVQGSLSAAQGGSFRMDDSQVIGNVNVLANSGPVRITRVTINGDLSCDRNRPAPTGTWIRVDGTQRGQCQGL